MGGVQPPDVEGRADSAGYAGSGGEYAAAIPEVKRLVIKNANLSIVVDDPAKAMESVSWMADEMGGFVVTASLYKRSLDTGVEVPEAAITIRVPAERLNDALDRIKAQSSQPVLSEGVNSEDVTSQYVDLQSRLTNAEATEKQLQAIMDSATTTEEVLSVYDKLVAVRGEIETIKGQIKYYEESAALSAISVSLIADEAVQPLTIGTWQPAGDAKRAIQALIVTLKFLFKVATWIVLYIIPVLVVIITPPYLVMRGIIWLARRGKRAKAAPATPSAPPPPPAASAG